MDNFQEHPGYGETEEEALIAEVEKLREQNQVVENQNLALRKKVKAQSAYIEDLEQELERKS